MTIAWPTGVNLYAMTGSYSEKPDTNIAEFAPEVGPSKRRRRMSISSRVVSFTTRMTFAEYEIFDTWFRDTLKDGSLPFYRPRPRTGFVEQYIFDGDAPEAHDDGFNLMQVQLQMKRMPNSTASWLPLLSTADITKVPTAFADFSTEGSTDPHYWYNGDKYASFAKWLAAMGGTYSRATAATDFKSGLLQAAAAINVPRFPTDANGSTTGIRLTGTGTEGCLWNRDLTNAVWTKTNATAAKTQTGIDGVANSATLLTATAANATIAQTTAFGSNSYMTGAWVKRITGTGTIQISIDGGSTRTTIVPTGSWVFYPISAPQTLASPHPWIGITTSADAVAVDFVSLRATSTPIADPIATTTATVGQAGDICSFPYSLQTFSAFVRVINELKTQGLTSPRLIGTSGAGSASPVFHSDTQFGTYNSARTLVKTFGGNLSDDHKMMVAGSASSTLFTVDGQVAISDANPLIIGALTSLFLGSDNGAASFMNGDMRQCALWNVAASSADITRLTT